MLQLDEHIQALTAPTMELALIQKKRASDLGLEERDPSDLLRKFISQAGPGATIGTAEPGQLSPDSSTPEKADSAWKRFLGQQGAARPGYEGLAPDAGSPIAGRTNQEASTIAKEGFKIPQFGEWQVDTLLREAARAAGRRATKQYGSYASEALSNEEEPLSPEEWQQQQGPLAASNLAQRFEGGASRIAEASLLHKKIFQPMLDIGFGASHMGASLGYTPQGEGVFGASHILGIPNPIAAFTSPAAKQGLGTVVNAAEAAFGGTGIGLGEASNLRQALASQGWTNQRSGGALGFTVGGQQETLAQTLEPLVKMGFNSPTSIEQLGSWTNALKLGQATPQELTKTLEQLPEAVKVLHKTLEEVTQGMEDFAAKTVEGGSTMIHGAHAYNEIWKNTGINPLLTQAANEGTFGKVQAAQKGVLPWQITSMTGNQSSTNAYAAVRQLAEIAGPGKAVTTTNKYGETETISAEAAKLAMMHQLEPNLTTEYMKRMLQIGPHMEAAASAQHKANQLSAFISQKRHENEAYGKNTHAVFKLEPEIAHLQKLKKEGEKQGEGEYGKLNEGQMEDLGRKETALIKAKRGAAGEGTLNVNQEDHVVEALAGKGGLYERAKEAGLEKHGELKQWMMESPEKQVKNITAALSKIAEVKPERSEEAKAEIVLSPNAEKWFKLQFPNAKSPKEEANAGGKSTASQAAQPSTGLPGEVQANKKLFEQAHRNEAYFPPSKG